MKKTFLSCLKWLIPFFFTFGGFFFVNFVHGHSFLGFIFFILAIIAACYLLLDLLARRYGPAARILRRILTGVLCLGILVCGITEAVIIHASFGAENPQCDYVIVLGAKVNGTTPSLSLSDRIDAAQAFLEANPGTIAILSGGQGKDEGISEAACMYRELTARGIHAQQLWLEDKATSTWENLKFSLDLIEERTGIRPVKIGLLSSEYHLFRASLFARDCGVEAVGIPAKTSWVSLKINYFTREVAGVWHYLLLGGQYHD